jgi:hypothetical protein
MVGRTHPQIRVNIRDPPLHFCITPRSIYQENGRKDEEERDQTKEKYGK